MERAYIQYTVPLKAEFGQLQRLAVALAREQVTVQALSWQAEGEAGFIRFVTDRTLGVTKALESLGWTAVQTPVLSVSVPDRPGELARLFKLLDNSGVGVQEMYGATGQAEACRLILSVDRLERAEQLLAAYNDTFVLLQ